MLEESIGPLIKRDTKNRVLFVSIVQTLQEERKTISTSNVIVRIRLKEIKTTCI